MKDLTRSTGLFGHRAETVLPCQTTARLSTGRCRYVGVRLCVWLAVCSLAPPASGEIAGDIVRVGYLATAGAVVRTGVWTPVVVDLRLQNQSSFDGVLRLRQFDRDGDVYVDSVPVHLFADGGAQKRYWLYTVANPSAARRHVFAVELLETTAGDNDEATGKLVSVLSGGKAIPMLTPPVPPQPVPDDHYLILSLVDGPLGKIRHLLDPEVLDDFDRSITLAHAAPTALPGKWIGLEMIDCIVWDEADPTHLTEAQEQALLEWVRQGGKLVLAAARTADAVAQAKYLGPLLPVKIGPVRAVTDLPQVRNDMLLIRDGAGKADHKPIVVASCEVVADPDVKHVLFDEGLGATMVASRRVGRGHLLFVAAALRDLLENPEGSAVDFFKRLLELRRNPISSTDASANYVPLIRYFDEEVGFYSSGGARMAMAIIFAIAYVLAATLGVWKVLQARDLLKHSWTALAVTAGVASTVSLAGVQAIHGVRRQVHQLTVVDAEAGGVGALATGYFGLTTSIHSNVDVWLPEDALLDREPARTVCTLRPMLDWRNPTDMPLGYTDPARYWIKPATAEIHDVPVRATLKEFEGRWRGDLRGTVNASLATEKVIAEPGGVALDYVLTEDSWIENQLGVDLKDCYLLLAERDAFIPQTFNEVAQRSFSDIVRALPLGEIKSGARVALFDRLYRDDAGNFLSHEDRKQRHLNRVQKTWGKPFAAAANAAFGGNDLPRRSRLARYQDAVLLMTVLAEIDPTRFEPNFVRAYPVFSRAQCRQLDISSLLTRRTAVFVGFSDEAGPLRLCARTGRRAYAPVEPTKARTVYRFVIPVKTSDNRADEA